MRPRELRLMTKRPGREADPTNTSSAEVKNMLTSYLLVSLCSIKDRSNFCVTFIHYNEQQYLRMLIILNPTVTLGNDWNIYLQICKVPTTKIKKRLINEQSSWEEDLGKLISHLKNKFSVFYGTWKMIYPPIGAPQYFLFKTHTNQFHNLIPFFVRIRFV
jgi:hypothetical protein